ncbi:hypothetical protein GCM10011328_12970 [Hafnia psychrotolerans]|jgi:hypothetical protein|uniref:Uncharacterized protein n=1 Tax=Hafnia psychrotolerans TaxID=1477018 RepID=A0ABQ1G9M5_9GAMM|nr:hypothetical protein GCM10011328_12970 [Hafnia psychrotolerans]
MAKIDRHGLTAGTGQQQTAEQQSVIFHVVINPRDIEQCFYESFI